MPDKITCILHGSFEDHLPTDSNSNAASLEPSAANTIKALLAYFDIDPEMVHYAILNGQYVEESAWSEPLPAGSTVRLWPRLAGG